MSNIKTTMLSFATINKNMLTDELIETRCDVQIIRNKQSKNTAIQRRIQCQIGIR